MNRPILAPDTPARFGRFYRDHFAIAWRGLARLGVPPTDCEDAAQDVFVAAYRRWHAFDGRCDRRVWLLGIVRKIAWRYRRGESRRARRLGALATVGRESSCVETACGEREAWQRLHRFLEGLDVDKRDAFVLGELEQLGRVELGGALGISPNTAYSRLQAARRRFLEHFATPDGDGAEVLAKAERAPQPPDRARAQVWAAIVTQLGEAAPLVAATTAAAVRLTGAGWATKLGLGGATIVVAGLGAVSIERGATSRGDAPGSTAIVEVAREYATAATTPATLPPASPQHTAEPTAPSARVVEHPTRAEATPRARPRDDRELEAEIAMLIAAREALLRDDALAADQALGAHRSRFGAGARLLRLRQQIERELDTRVISRARGGDVEGQEAR